MKWFRVALELIGGASLLAVVGFGSWLLYNNSSDRFDKASRKDALFVLNWAGLPTNQNYRVVSSYESRRNFTGDHLDYFCIELPKFQVADWAKDHWHDGPEQDALLADALETALNSAREHGSCVPSASEANSPAMKMMFTTVLLHNRYATAADLILYDPQKRMLYYVSYKT
jgi:hypothetical protein